MLRLLPLAFFDLPLLLMLLLLPLLFVLAPKMWGTVGAPTRGSLASFRLPNLRLRNLIDPCRRREPVSDTDPYGLLSLLRTLRRRCLEPTPVLLPLLRLETARGWLLV